MLLEINERSIVNINYFKKIGGKPVNIVIRFKAEERIKGLHLRGQDVRCAGNFFAWQGLDELFEDVDFLDAIYQDASEAYEKHHLGTSSFSYDFRQNVGWSSTDDAKNYDLGDQEHFVLNKRSFGKRIRIECDKIRAPLTSLVTVIYELRDEGYGFTIVVHSVYPGPDIGDLNGDVSTREHCVFFGWDHLGQ